MLLAQIYIHKVVELKVLPAAMHSSIALSYSETIMLDQSCELTLIIFFTHDLTMPREASCALDALRSI